MSASGPGGNLNFTVVDALEPAAFTGEIRSSTNVLHRETLSGKKVQFHAGEGSSDGRHWQEIGRKNGLANATVAVK